MPTQAGVASSSSAPGSRDAGGLLMPARILEVW
jgi:hypothetical protein